MADTPVSTSNDEGPVQGPLAHAVEALKNACIALGPLNFLPDQAPEADIRTLEAATAIVRRLRP